MICRIGKNLGLREGDAPPESAAIERDGYAVLRSVFEPDEVDLLRDECDAVFEEYSPERFRDDTAEFRYEVLHRSGACQAAVGHPRILEIVEALLGPAAARARRDAPTLARRHPARPHRPRAYAGRLARTLLL